MRGRRSSFENRFDAMAAYLFEGASATSDLTGNGHTLSTAGTPKAVGGHPRSRRGAMYLDNTNYYYTDHSDWNIQGAFSAEFMLALPTFGTHALSLAARQNTSSGQTYWGVYMASDGIYQYHHASSGGPNWKLGGYWLPIQFAHYVFTRDDSGTMKAYVNGLLVAQAEGSVSNATATSQRTYIGRSQASNPALGRYQYFAFYTSELSTDQILYLAKLRGAVK